VSRVYGRRSWPVLGSVLVTGVQVEAGPGVERHGVQGDVDQDGKPPDLAFDDGLQWLRDEFCALLAGAAGRGTELQVARTGVIGTEGEDPAGYGVGRQLVLVAEGGGCAAISARAGNQVEGDVLPAWRRGAQFAERGEDVLVVV
jgi:hypothetical protein